MQKRNHTTKKKSFDEIVTRQKEELNSLLSIWERFANIYANSESYIYEWQNYLDARKLIDEMIESMPADEKIMIGRKLEPLDKKVIAETFEISECIWGKKEERKNQYNRIKNWYYYRVNQYVFNSEANIFTRL